MDVKDEMERGGADGNFKMGLDVSPNRWKAAGRFRKQQPYSCLDPNRQLDFRQAALALDTLMYTMSWPLTT